MFSRSTVARLSSGNTRNTLPILPRSLPAITITVSFFFTRANITGSYRTSGAREIIFINRLARNSRATGPKIRVPTGSRWLSNKTAELVSKRMYEPSGRPISFAVRTITARMTSPFFTLAFGIASLIDTTISSPTDAYLRRVPPSTRTHRTRRAPELSATSRMVSTWIILCSFHSLNHCRFNDVLYAPALVPAEGPRLHNRHLVPDVTAVVRVMGFVFLELSHVLLVDGVM